MEKKKEQVNVGLFIKVTQSVYDKFKSQTEKGGFNSFRGYLEFLIASADKKVLAAKDRNNMLKEFVELKGNLGHVTGNVNQIAHQVNVMKFAGEERFYREKLCEISSKLDEVVGISKELTELIKKFI